MPRVSRRNRSPIDYLTLNDGLEEDTPASPKCQKRGANRPRSEPSSRRIWAQQQIGSPKADTTLPGIPTRDSLTLGASTSTEAQPSTSLVGVQPTNESGHGVEQTLTGVQTCDTLPDLVLNHPETATASGEQELDVANVLLSLGDSLESTLDAVDDNADLMPIGGGSNAPIDVAPEPL